LDWLSPIDVSQPYCPQDHEPTVIEGNVVERVSVMVLVPFLKLSVKVIVFGLPGLPRM
jgi:hypothetical protein